VGPFVRQRDENGNDNPQTLRCVGKITKCTPEGRVLPVPSSYCVCPHKEINPGLHLMEKTQRSLRVRGDQLHEVGILNQRKL